MAHRKGEYSGQGPEPLFIPAAVCSLAAIPLFIGAVCSGNFNLLAGSGIIWGAGIFFWRENGKLGGGTPWPTSVRDFVNMVNGYHELSNRKRQ